MDFLASGSLFFCSEFFLLVEIVIDIRGGQFLRKDHILTKEN